jgi:hypothetical protein
MAYKSRSSVITVNGRTWWINSKVSGIYTTMMKSMIGQLDAMLSHHSRIHVVRFDLRQYEYTATNKRMTDFNARLIKWLKARYGLKRVGYMWVREQERKKHQHYHYALILDGHKVKHPSAVLDKVREIWEHMDGSDWRPKNCYYNVKRDDVESLQAAIWRVSYLAKGRGKGYKPAQTKNYGTSRASFKCLKV